MPFDLVDQTALIGPLERITERLHAYAEAGVTTLAVSAVDDTVQQQTVTLRALATAFDASGLSR